LNPLLILLSTRLNAPACVASASLLKLLNIHAISLTRMLNLVSVHIRRQRSFSRPDFRTQHSLTLTLASLLTFALAIHRNFTVVRVHALALLLCPLPSLFLLTYPPLASVPSSSVFPLFRLPRIMAHTPYQFFVHQLRTSIVCKQPQNLLEVLAWFQVLKCQRASVRVIAMERQGAL
jgi:hypothetical protein